MELIINKSFSQETNLLASCYTQHHINHQQDSNHVQLPTNLPIF